VRSRSSAVSDRECQDFSSCSLWHASVRQSPRIQTTSSLFICFAQHAGYGSSRYHPVRLKVSTSSGETVRDSFRTLRVLKPPSGSLLLIVSRNSGSARLKQGEATRAQVIPRLGPITEGARFSPCCCCSPPSASIHPKRSSSKRKQTATAQGGEKEEGGRAQPKPKRGSTLHPRSSLCQRKGGSRRTSHLIYRLKVRSTTLPPPIDSTLPYITPTWIRRNDWQPTNSTNKHTSLRLTTIHSTPDRSDERPLFLS
jgi:hypothetical protein